MGKRSASTDSPDGDGDLKDPQLTQTQTQTQTQVPIPDQVHIPTADDANDASAQSVSVSAADVGAAAAAMATASLTGPPSVSAVWAYFHKDALGNSVCNFCERVIKGHHSSNLLSHLRTAGRTDVVHQQASVVCEEHRETKRHAKRQKLVLPSAADIAAAYPQLVAAAAAAAAMPSLGFKKEPGFPTTAAAVAAAAASGVLTKEQREAMGVITPQPLALTQEQVAQDFALMVLVDNLPLDVAHHPGMENYTRMLLGDNKVALPDDNSVAKLIRMLHESLFLTTKMVLSRVRVVGVSLEALVHPLAELAESKYYLMVNAHFTLNFRPYHIAIGCTPIFDGLDEPLLKSILVQCFERVGIKDKVVACVEGDLPWKDETQGLLSAESLPCIYMPTSFEGRSIPGEVQQTILVKSPSSVLHHCLPKSTFAICFTQFIDSIDTFLQTLTTNPEALSALKRKHPQFGRDALSLGSDATFYVDFLLQLHEALPTLEQIALSCRMEFLPMTMIELLTKMIKKLRPFLRYAEALEGESNVKTGSDKEAHKGGLSSVSTIFAALVAYAEKQASSATTDSSAWKAFFASVAKDLRAQCGLFPPICYAATLLDPRYKDRDCCFLEPSLEQPAAEICIRQLFQLFSDERGDDGSAVGTTSSMLDKVSNDGSKESKDSNMQETEEDDLLSHLPSATAKDGPQDGDEMITSWGKELTAFLSLPVIERNADPLLWWRTNQLRFPFLASFAEILLVLPTGGMSGEATRRGLDQVLLRVDGMMQDPMIASDPALVEAFLCFCKSRDVAIEWLRSCTDPGVSLPESDAAANSTPTTTFKHVENV